MITVKARVRILETHVKYIDVEANTSLDASEDETHAAVQAVLMNRLNAKNYKGDSHPFWTFFSKARGEIFIMKWMDLRLRIRPSLVGNKKFTGGRKF